jgi:hypothetical protein
VADLHDVGDCYVFRGDGKPLTRDGIFFMWDYLNKMLDVMGDNPDDAAKVFNNFCRTERFERALSVRGKGLTF